MFGYLSLTLVWFIYPYPGSDQISQPLKDGNVTALCRYDSTGNFYVSLALGSLFFCYNSLVFIQVYLAFGSLLFVTIIIRTADNILTNGERGNRSLDYPLLMRSQAVAATHRRRRHRRCLRRHRRLTQRPTVLISIRRVIQTEARPVLVGGGRPPPLPRHSAGSHAFLRARAVVPGLAASGHGRLTSEVGGASPL